VPLGPVTRARVKKFKEELSNLIVKLDDEAGVDMEKEGIQGGQDTPFKNVIRASLD